MRKIGLGSFLSSLLSIQSWTLSRTVAKSVTESWTKWLFHSHCVGFLKELWTRSWTSLVLKFVWEMLQNPRKPKVRQNRCITKKIIKFLWNNLEQECESTQSEIIQVLLDYWHSKPTSSFFYGCARIHAQHVYTLRLHNIHT